MAIKKIKPGGKLNNNAKLTDDEHALLALSPLDGRYKNTTKKLGEYFSEFALQKYRLLIEVLYLEDFCRITGIDISGRQQNILDTIVPNFSRADAKRIKEIEKGKKNSKGIITVPGINHDLKSVEVFLREKLTALKFNNKILGAIHFGLTSGDIDNIARTWMLADATNIMMKDTYAVIDRLKADCEDYASLAMVARTHGQPAVPTTYGKEVNVFKRRLTHQLGTLTEFTFSVKFGGAVGNFNALHVAYPKIDWEKFADTFVEKISNRMIFGKLLREKVTTQIDSYDSQAEFFAVFTRFNTILMGLCHDMWEMISDDLLLQKKVKEEVGSSAMPQKVNPIDFENAEGNLGLANSQFFHFMAKLPISRRQRDLTDSTVVRNIGVALGHSLIAYQSLLRGLNKISPNVDKMQAQLEANPEIITEGIQTILRREGMPDAYNMLKDLSRGNKLTRAMIAQFVHELKVKQSVKQEILAITPQNYLGYAKNLAWQ